MIFDKRKQNPKKVLITAKIYQDEAQKYLSLFDEAAIKYAGYFPKQMDEEGLLKALKNCEALLCEPEHLSSKVMKASPKLKLISIVGKKDSTLDHQEGIAMYDSQKADLQSIADYSFAMLLHLAKGPFGADQKSLRKDVWGQTLGLLGFNATAKAMLERAWGFNMHVLYHDPCEKHSFPFSRQVDLDTLLASSDFISIHLDKKIQEVLKLDGNILRKMQKEPILINTSQPNLFSSNEIIEAFEEKMIAGLATSNESFKVEHEEKLKKTHALITYRENAIQTKTAPLQHALEAVRNVLANIERRD